MTFTRVLVILLGIVAAAAVQVVNAQDKPVEYRLGDGDNIRISVFQNPDLALETRVSENGSISFPLIGTVRIGGMTMEDAAQAIAGRLKAGKYIQEPQVNIQLLQNRGSQVSVLGQVGRAGRYPLETFNTKLSEMLAIAGGIGAGGADIAIVTGTRDGKPFRREVDIAAMFLDNRLQVDDFVVAGGDVIYVHRQPMFYIYGEVQRPGSYRIERGMTVRQALVAGGGLSPKGTERGFRVYRKAADGSIERNSLDLNEPVRPDDVLHVGESLF